MLCDILNDIQKEEDAALQKEIEAAASNPLYQNKEGEAEAFAAEYTKQKKKNRLKALPGVAAVLIGLFIICAFTVPINVESSKQSLFELMLNYSSSDHIVVGNDQLLAYDGKYIPSLIPRGYEVEKISSTDNFKSIIITNYTDNTIVFSEYNTDDISITLPESGETTETDINGFDAIYSKSKASQMIVVYAEDRIFTATCNNTEFDLIGFALLVELRY